MQKLWHFRKWAANVPKDFSPVSSQSSLVWGWGGNQVWLSKAKKINIDLYQTPRGSGLLWPFCGRTWEAHYGSKQPNRETLNLKLSHELDSEWISERVSGAERTRKWFQCKSGYRNFDNCKLWLQFRAHLNHRAAAKRVKKSSLEPHLIEINVWR